MAGKQGAAGGHTALLFLPAEGLAGSPGLVPGGAARSRTAGHPLVRALQPQLRHKASSEEQGCGGLSRVLSLVMQMAAPSALQAERLREKGPFESYSNFPGE